MELIKLVDLCKTYHLGEIDVPVLKGVSLEIQRGEMVALMGVSGSGKSTLMNILGCLDRPTSGEYWLDGEEVSQLSADARAVVRNRKVGFVFQSFNLLARTSAIANVMTPLAYTASDLSRAEGKKRAAALLTRVGLGDRLDHQPSQLSGGQQQRVAIARALINNPPLLFADEPTGNLDSTTSKEILRMFQTLSAEEGITIVLVTHDAEVARYANRTIHIKDGIIEQDIDNVSRASTFTPATARRPVPRRVAARQSYGGGRITNELINVLSLATRALARNVMRSVLTTLGIIIGVGAVIAMVEIGQGSKAAVAQTIRSMGSNNLLIQPGTASSGGVSFGSGSVMTLTPADADAIARECQPAVDSVAPVVRARTQIVFGNRNWVPLYIYGTMPSFLDVREWELAEGRRFTDQEVKAGADACMVGQTIVRELFNGGPALGQVVRINNHPMTVVGVLTRKGANMMGVDQDDIVLAPWRTIKFKVSGQSAQTSNQSTANASDPRASISTGQTYPGGLSATSLPYSQQSTTQQLDNPQPVLPPSIDQILVRVSAEQLIPVATRQITSLLHERHRIKAGQPDDFNIRDMTELSNAMGSTSQLMSALLLAVALISLVVGGVGIMNIMLVSVTERTREIGLRMAVGARPRDILRQFLAEAIVLCLLGGAVGILVGRGVSLGVRDFLHWPTLFSLPAVVASVGVSASVGVLFGYYPAWKASRLDPIEALRYE